MWDVRDGDGREEGGAGFREGGAGGKAGGWEEGGRAGVERIGKWEVKEKGRRSGPGVG